MEDVSDKITLAHISETVGRLAESNIRVEDKLNPDSENYILSAVEQQIAPLVEVYNGALFAKKFIIGLSVLVIAISAIGAAAIWLVNYIRHGQ